MSDRVWWADVPSRKAAMQGSIFEVEPWIANGADSYVTHECFGCGVVIGYARARVEVVATTNGDEWTLVHESFTGDAKSGRFGSCPGTV